MTVCTPISNPEAGGKLARSWRSLVYGSLWTLLGNAVYGLSIAAIPVVLHRFGTLETVGVYTLGYAVSAPVVVLTMLQLRVVMVVNKADGTTFGVYLVARCMTTLAAAVAIAVIALLIGGPRGSCLAVIGLAKCLDAIGDCYLGFFQARGRLEVMGISLILNGVGTASMVGVLMASTSSLQVAVWGSVGASFVASVIYPVMAKRRIGETSVRAHRRGVLVDALAQLRRSVSLGMSSGVGSLNVNVPKYVLEAEAGTALQGAFAAIGQIMLLLTTAVGSISQATLPWFVHTYQSRGRSGLASALKTTLVSATLVGVLFVAAAASVGAPLVRKFLGVSYPGTQGLVLWSALATAIGALSWFLDGALSTMRIFGPQLWLNCVTLLSTVVSSIVLIPSDPVVGAAQAVCLGSTTQVVGRVVFVTKHLGRSWVMVPLRRGRSSDT